MIYKDPLACKHDLTLSSVSREEGRERFLFLFQAEDGIRVLIVTGVQTCALPISEPRPHPRPGRWRKGRKGPRGPSTAPRGFDSEVADGPAGGKGAETGSQRSPPAKSLPRR